jgi:hypothetical protein
MPNLPPPPESGLREFELSEEQRTKLLGFVERFDKVSSDGSFDASGQWNDVELIALALRASEILGFERESLEQLFRDEFNIEGMGEEEVLSSVLSIAAMVDIEQRIRCKAGGRN